MPDIDLTALTREQKLALIGDLIDKLTAPPTPTPINAPPELVSAATLAARWSVPKSWILERHRAGHLRGQRLGRYVRFAESDVAEFMASDHARNLTESPRRRRPALVKKKKSPTKSGTSHGALINAPSSQAQAAARG